MAIAKVFLLVLLVIITVVTMSGGNPQGHAYGFQTGVPEPCMSTTLKEPLESSSAGGLLLFMQDSALRALI
jgi:amino acid permease